MDRSRFGFDEVVTADTTSPGTNDDKLNRAFDRVETSANERQVDLHPAGIVSGLSVEENSVPNMTLRVLAGVAQDQTGNRIEVPSTQSVDMEVDYQGNAIALPGAGNEKYASVFLKFKRLNQEATQDGNSVAYYESELESFEIRVRAGSEALASAATPPALQGSEILLADVLLTPGMTSITTGDIELLDRRQDAWKLSPTNALPKQIRVGTAKAAVTELLGWLNDLLDGDLTLDTNGVTHSNGSEKFAGTQDPPTGGSLQTWLRTLVAYLGSSSGGNGVGASRIGMSSPGTWADGTTAGAAGQLSVLLTGIVSTLTSTSGARGAGKLTAAAVSQSPTSLVAGTIAEQITALLTAINARALAAFTPSGGIAATTVHTAIAELDTDKAAVAGANTFTAKQTFDLASAGVGLETAADTRADFNGEVEMPRVNVGVQAVGVIAANTQIADNVGLVIVQCPANNNDNYNLAMPEPATGTPVLVLKFYGGAGTSRRVWLCTTAEIASSPPTNYYTYWEASVNARAGAVFAWDGTRWRHILSTGLTGTAGGGTLAE